MSIFKKVKSIIQLMKDINLRDLSELSEKIDLSQVMSSVGELDDKQLNYLMKMLTEKSKKGQHKLPPIDGDFYDYDLKLYRNDFDYTSAILNFRPIP